MHKLSVIILSCAIDNEIYEMNCRCLESLRMSESWDVHDLQIILIESYKESNFVYGTDVCVVFPDEKFNFHRFLNIGVDASDGEFVALCNNDILFEKGWFSAMMKVKISNPRYMCFSPVDRSYPLMGESTLPLCRDFYIGWTNKKHFAAWCFVWERKVFEITGKFDETFDFYSADDDELMTLRKFAIHNIVVTRSEVKHLSQVVTKKDVKYNNYKIFDHEKYPLTSEEIRRGYSWLWDDIRFYLAYKRMNAKWGNEHMINRVHNFFERHPKLFVRPITMLLYNKNINGLLCYLTGIKK